MTGEINPVYPIILSKISHFSVICATCSFVLIAFNLPLTVRVAKVRLFFKFPERFSEIWLRLCRAKFLRL